MVERKILPERHRGQSWRRMLLNADGWERGKDTMLVDGLETGAVKAMSSEARERLHPQYQGARERNHRALPVGSLIHTAFCANRSTVVNRRVRPPEASAQRESRARRLENIGNQRAKASVECERRRLPLSSTRTCTATAACKSRCRGLVRHVRSLRATIAI